MEEIMDKAIRVAEAVEVFTVTSEETPVQFEANCLKHIQSKQSQIVALRIIRDGRIGYSITTNPDDVDSLVNAAVETAEFGMEAMFDFPTLNTYPKVETYDREVETVSLEQMIELGEEIIATIKQHTIDIVCEVGVSKDIISINIMNSSGNSTGYNKSVFSLGIEGSLIQGTDMLFVTENQNSCRPLTYSKNITDTVIKQLEWARNQAVVSSKPLPVIFTSTGVASALINPLMVAFNGRTVLEGASPISNRLGEPIFDSKLNLHDDATINYRPSSHPFDDEGVTSKRTPLIEAGIPINYLYDLQTAALADTQSTGNGKRHGSRLPSPSPNAFAIQPGDVSFDNMLADIREGLVIEYLMGASQGNILGGDFSGNVLLGYKVENGKIVGRVKDTMVSGNIYQVLNNIIAIGSDTKWVGSFLNSPSIYCSSLSVTVND
jgi:PmbA protein